MAVFDPLVFDASIFDATDIAPTLYKVFVPREQQRVQAGTVVTITAYYQNAMSTPGKRYPLNTSSLPQIAIDNPDDTVKLALTNMINADQGIYIYNHQTLVGDTVGPYQGYFKAVNGDKTTISKKMLLFAITL